MIEVSELTVRFGGVVPIDDMTLTFPGGTCGLIGPNGAGKTTFFNVLSGFVRPLAGSVIAFGDDLLAMPDFRRARWGVRRTFQTEQAIANLSVFENVLLVHEHTGGTRATRRQDVHGRHRVRRSRTTIRTIRSARSAPRERRLVEVARAVVGQPRLVLLDEPAAGLPDEETEQLGERHPADPRADRSAGDPRRPRHEPRVGVLRDHRGARLRAARSRQARRRRCCATSRSSAAYLGTEEVVRRRERRCDHRRARRAPRRPAGAARRHRSTSRPAR